MSFLFAVLMSFQFVESADHLVPTNKHDSLRKVFSEISWNITAPHMNEDGNRFILRKRSWEPAFEQKDMDNDTILFFKLPGSANPVISAIRVGSRQTNFVDNNHVLLTYNMQTELYDLKGQASKYFQDVTQMRVLNEKKQFVLHYGIKDNRRVELRSVDGDLLNEIENVVNFYVTKNENIYAVTENEKNLFELFILNEAGKEKMYATSRKVASLEIDTHESGCMIFEQNPDSCFQILNYIDFKNDTIYSLRESLSVCFQRGFTEIIKEGSIYFLKIWCPIKSEKNSLIDIWYGNDSQLDQKFERPITVLTYVWEPKRGSVQQIGTDLMTRNINIGDDRYFLCFDPYSLQDYSREQPLLEMYIYDRMFDRYEMMDTISPILHLSGKGEYVLYIKNNIWNLYHIASGEKKMIGLVKELGNPWFTHDCSAILFEGNGALWKYELRAGTISQEVILEGYEVSIVNGVKSTIPVPGASFNKRSINQRVPLLIKLYDPIEKITSYVLWHKRKIIPVIAPTTKCIKSLNFDMTHTHFSYIEEDYNMPPRFVYKKIGKNEQIVYESNKGDKAISSLKREIISYTNSDGIPLKGVLYYPLRYTPSEKYPMVVHIYESQHHLANMYPYPSYSNSLGFNIRLFLEKGYFVFLPDIIIQGDKGPGMDALDCVHKALDALEDNPFIDKEKIGLIGHSFGGYEVDFIATHSDRFAAYVSGSGHSDIIWAYHAFNYNFLFPDHVRIEANMYKMGVPFSRNKALYFQNNPIYWAENVSAPVLLWSGTEDRNVTADHSMAFYNALRRNKKDVIALFYKGEEHALQNKDNQFDLTYKILDWFDHLLKDMDRFEWIGK